MGIENPNPDKQRVLRGVSSYAQRVEFDRLREKIEFVNNRLKDLTELDRPQQVHSIAEILSLAEQRKKLGKNIALTKTVADAFTEYIGSVKQDLAELIKTGNLKEEEVPPWLLPEPAPVLPSTAEKTSDQKRYEARGHILIVSPDEVLFDNRVIPLKPHEINVLVSLFTHNGTIMTQEAKEAIASANSKDTVSHTFFGLKKLIGSDVIMSDMRAHLSSYSLKERTYAFSQLTDEEIAVFACWLCLRSKQTKIEPFDHQCAQNLINKSSSSFGEIPKEKREKEITRMRKTALDKVQTIDAIAKETGSLPQEIQDPDLQLLLIYYGLNRAMLTPVLDVNAKSEVIYDVNGDSELVKVCIKLFYPENSETSGLPCVKETVVSATEPKRAKEAGLKRKTPREIITSKISMEEITAIFQDVYQKISTEPVNSSGLNQRYPVLKRTWFETGDRIKTYQIPVDKEQHLALKRKDVFRVLVGKQLEKLLGGRIHNLMGEIDTIYSELVASSRGK